MSPEPRYTLAEAVRLIPMPSVNALRVYLHRHPELAELRYRAFDRGRHPRRLLTESEIETIRKRAVK